MDFIIRMMYILLFSTWIFGISVAIPLIYFRHYYERQWKNYLETYCTEDTVLIYPYWHIFAGLSVWAPLTIMAICYTAILIKVLKCSWFFKSRIFLMRAQIIWFVVRRS